MITNKFFRGIDDLTDAFFIRKQVFIDEQGISETIERDSYDQSSDHVVIYENSQPIGTGRLVFKYGEYSIGRVAVLKEHRAKNVGALVVNLLKDKAIHHGASEVHVHAQKEVEGFYRKLGYKAYGDIYEEAGIEHISMSINR